MRLHSRLKSLCSAALLGAAAAMPAPAMAANEAMLDLLKALYENGQITAEQYELISNAAKADAEKAEGAKSEAKQVAEDAAKKVDEKIAEMPKITTDGKLVVESADGDWSFQPIGRIFWDTMWVDDDDGSNEESGTELRRARMGFQASFMKYFKAKLELDFATSVEPSWKDVWISYNNKNSLGKYWLKFGQQHVPFGHATISSSKYMALMRRPLFGDGPQRSRNVGVAFRQESADSNRWFVHTGGFLESLPETDDEVNTDSGGEEAVFYAIRGGGTPFYKDDKHLLHIAGSYQWQNNNGDTFNNIDNALLTHIGNGDTLEADFGSNTDDINAFGVDVIGIWGPFHAIGEYVYWDVSDPDGDADLHAWAVDAGWFLTGESMKYKYGAFSGIGPKRAVGKGGWGAWQLAARIENMDLNDGATIVGGEADVFTAGINWYPVKNVRFMANWATVLDYECAPTGANTIDGCAGPDGNEPHAFSLRGQVYW